MSTTAAMQPSRFAAWRWLVVLSFRRLWWSFQTLVGVGLVVLLAAMVILWALRRPWEVIPFSRAIITDLYLGFMLPLLCLCFGTQSLGSDWEDRSLVWLLTRPLSRPAIYLGKFLAALPWTLALTLGGLLFLGVLAGSAGLRAVMLFWPAVALGTVAYLSLFQLLGVAFRRSTVIGIVYSFVLETLVGNMPGLVKRASVGFYSHCIVYDVAAQHGLDKDGTKPGVVPDIASFFLPVDGTTAVIVLWSMTAVFLLLGIIVFSRREYRELT